MWYEVYNDSRNHLNPELRETKQTKDTTTPNCKSCNKQVKAGRLRSGPDGLRDTGQCIFTSPQVKTKGAGVRPTT